MNDTFERKIILSDVPAVLKKPLAANEDLRAALVARYDAAMEYFGVDPRFPAADQDLAFRLLDLIFPAFDFKPKSRAGRPRLSAWQLRELYRRMKSGEWTSRAASREEICRFLGGPRVRAKGTLANLASKGKQIDAALRMKRIWRATRLRKHNRREALLAMQDRSSSFFKPKK